VFAQGEVELFGVFAFGAEASAQIVEFAQAAANGCGASLDLGGFVLQIA
jgi:hypothetical protein